MTPVGVAFAVGTVWGAVVAAVVWIANGRRVWLTIAALAVVGGLLGGGLSAWLSP